MTSARSPCAVPAAQRSPTSSKSARHSSSSARVAAKSRCWLAIQARFQSACAALNRSPRCPKQRLGPGRRRRVRTGQRQDLVEPPPSLGAVAVDRPEAPERAGQPERPSGVAAPDQPAQGGAEVGVLLLAPSEPGLLLAP